MDRVIMHAIIVSIMAYIAIISGAKAAEVELIELNSKEILLDAPLDLVFDKLSLSVPKRGDKKQLVDLSLRNAKFYRLEKHKKELEKLERSLSNEKFVLGAPKSVIDEYKGRQNQLTLSVKNLTSLIGYAYTV